MTYVLGLSHSSATELGYEPSIPNVHVQFALRGVTPQHQGVANLQARGSPQPLTVEQNQHVWKDECHGDSASITSTWQAPRLPVSSTPNPFILAHLPANRLSLLSLQLRLAFLWPMRGNRTPPRGFWERFVFPVKRKEIHKQTTHCRASMCLLPLDGSCEVMRRGAVAPTGTTFSTQTSFIF